MRNSSSLRLTFLRSVTPPLLASQSHGVRQGPQAFREIRHRRSLLLRERRERLNGLVWELNYRGELDFLHQAERQAEARKLTIEDGWVYFLHGWTQVVAEVFHLDLTPDLFAKLAEAAATIR